MHVFTSELSQQSSNKSIAFIVCLKEKIVKKKEDERYGGENKITLLCTFFFISVIDMHFSIFETMSGYNFIRYCHKNFRHAPNKYNAQKLFLAPLSLLFIVYFFIVFLITKTIVFLVNLQDVPTKGLS